MDGHYDESRNDGLTYLTESAMLDWIWNRAKKKKSRHEQEISRTRDSEKRSEKTTRARDSNWSVPANMRYITKMSNGYVDAQTDITLDINEMCKCADKQSAEMRWCGVGEGVLTNWNLSYASSIKALRPQRKMFKSMMHFFVASFPN